jgi:subtilase family serine protease
MKIRSGCLLAGLLVLACGGWAAAQKTIDTPHGIIVVPSSSIEHAQDVSVRAHTNHVIFLRHGSGTPAVSVPQGETPGSLGCVYQTNGVALGSGCPVSTSTVNIGGTGVIAIVDAYDYPTAQSDFDKFSAQFGLPLSTQSVCNGSQPCFKKVYAAGSKPKSNCGWAQEAALDIEWAHAMAPNAQIILVEARSNSFTDLFKAVDVATSQVVNGGSTSCPSGSICEGEVSMSWGGSEFSTESSYDSHFTSSAVVYFGASGDTGGKTIYPSASPNVVAAGGTSVLRSGGFFAGEAAWSGSGGGPSAYESRPSYQAGIVAIVGTKRGIPDFSFDADPYTGVSVYDSTSCQGLSGWLIFGGTSVASPSLAGIVNLASHFYDGSQTELNTIYSNLGSANFRDITSGKAGSYSAQSGWDFVTGVGSNLGTTGK